MDGCTCQEVRTIKPGRIPSSLQAAMDTLHDDLMVPLVCTEAAVEFSTNHMARQALLTREHYVL